jgi:hypothetical protein
MTIMEHRTRNVGCVIGRLFKGSQPKPHEFLAIFSKRFMGYMPDGAWLEAEAPFCATWICAGLCAGAKPGAKNKARVTMGRIKNLM